MKTKVTLIFGKINKKEQLFSDKYFSVFLNNKNELPSVVASKENIQNCLDEIFAKYLKLNKSWPDIRLSDARVFLESGVLTTEIVYTCFVPSIWSIEKTGRFYTRNQLRESNIELDKFLIDVISKQSISINR